MSKSKELGKKDVLIQLAAKNNNWLLILDNADDPEFDYSQYFPSGVYGTVLLTSRNSVLHDQSTIGFKSLDILGDNDCAKLFEKMVGKPQPAGPDTSDETTQDIVQLVRLLGAHTIALIQAGEYIKRRQCTIQQYVERFKESRKKLATYQPNPVYRSAYATFETSAAFLESSNDERDKDALFLLHLMPMMGNERLTVVLFKATWQAAKLVSAKEYRPTHELTDASHLLSYLTPFIQVAGIESQDKWDSFRLESAIGILESLSLVRLRSLHGWDEASLTMHPLVRAWAKDRQSPAGTDLALISAGSLLALASQTEQQLMVRYNGDLPYTNDPSLPPFLRVNMTRPYSLTYYYDLIVSPYAVPYITDNFAILKLKARSKSPKWSPSLAILTQILCLWFLAPITDLNKVRHDILKQLFLALDADPQHPSGELLPLYVFRIMALEHTGLGFEAETDGALLLTAVIDMEARNAEVSGNPMLFFKLLSRLAFENRYHQATAGGGWTLEHIRGALRKPICSQFLVHATLMDARAYVAQVYFREQQFEVVKEVLESQLPLASFRISSLDKLPICHQLLAVAYKREEKYEKMISLLSSSVPTWLNKWGLFDKILLFKLCCLLGTAYIGAGQPAQGLLIFEDGCRCADETIQNGSMKDLRLQKVRSYFQKVIDTVRSWMDAGKDIAGNAALRDLDLATVVECRLLLITGAQS